MAEAPQSDAGAPELSVVVPLYNEEENLPVLMSELGAALATTGLTHELIFVDDGSTDGSAEVLAGLAKSLPQLRILRHQRNAGQSAALVAGFRAARGRLVVTLSEKGGRVNQERLVVSRYDWTMRPGDRRGDVVLEQHLDERSIDDVRIESRPFDDIGAALDLAVDAIEGVCGRCSRGKSM